MVNGIESPELRASNRIARFVMKSLHDAGRVLLYNDLEVEVNKKMETSIETLKADDPTWTLKGLLEEIAYIFYVYELKKLLYVALSRNYFYVNTRVAKRLQIYNDRTVEGIIAYKGRPLGKSKIINYAKKFQEYDLGKCAGSILKILNDVYRRIPEGKTEICFRQLINDYKWYCAMTKVVFNFCDESCDTGRLAEFFSLFTKVFSLNIAVLKIDVVLLEGLIKAYEIDLIWSFTGSCIIKGVSMVPALVEIVNEMIDRADLEFTTHQKAKDISKMLMDRYEQFFTPGDGTVWIMFPSIPEDRIELIREFFLEYLRNKTRFYYTRCYEIVLAYYEDLLVGYQEQTSISLASVLYLDPKRFRFVKGYVMLATHMKTREVNRDLAPVEVPITMFICTAPHTHEELREGKGFVQEAGVNSAIMRFYQECKIKCEKTKEVSLVTLEVQGYCHKSLCIYDEQPVDDFTHFLRVGDYIKFMFLPQTFTNIYSPCYCLITDILGFLDPDEDYQEPQQPSQESCSKKDAKEDTKKDAKEDTKKDAKEDTKKDAKKDTKKDAKKDNSPSFDEMRGDEYMAYYAAKASESESEEESTDTAHQETADATPGTSASSDQDPKEGTSKMPETDNPSSSTTGAKMEDTVFNTQEDARQLVADAYEEMLDLSPVDKMIKSSSSKKTPDKETPETPRTSIFEANKLLNRMLSSKKK